MKDFDFNKVLKKCFGKEKDDKYHAIAMLCIYGLFISIVVVIIRLGGSSTNSNISNDNSINTSVPTSTPTSTPNASANIENDDYNVNLNDINYSYSYRVTYNGVTEVFLGKKIDDKEKFTLVKDGVTTEYGILNDNYLILENGTYHITENPSRFFKYCDVEKLLLLTENETKVETDNIIKYNISNSKLSKSYKDNININNELDNVITYTLENNNLKKVDLDFSNYISSIDGSTSTLTIVMEFADIGTTEDFEIKVN